MSEIKFSKIPDELTARDQWIVWRIETRDGNETKVPVDPTDPNQHGDATDPDAGNWVDFETARDVYQDRDDLAGIGFCFSGNDTITGVDLDDCRDPDTGELENWAVDVINRLNSFTEVSQSGTGVHVYIHGFVPDGGNRKDDIEMYDNDRFFAVTGDHLDITPATVETRAEPLKEIHREHIHDTDAPDAAPAPGGGVDIDDTELIEKAKAADNGDKFAALWDGRWQAYGYPSQSEADLALAGMLAFWTGGDRARVDALFRQSGLCREKWINRSDYRERTIDKALAGRSEFYNPNTNTRTATPDGGVKAQPAGNSEPRNTTPRETYFTEKEAYEASSVPEKAHVAWKVLEDTLDVISVEPDGTIHTCHNGLWIDGSGERKGGEQVLREATHEIMDTDFSKKAFNEVVEQIRATAAVHRSELSVPEGKIPVENGLLDIETRDIWGLKPGDYATAKLNTEYDPEAECPKFEQFVKTVTGNSRDRRLLQEYMGYTLLHWDLPFHKHLFLVGPEASGKSTFLNVVRDLLGRKVTCSITPQDLTGERFYSYQLEDSWANIRNDIPSDLIENAGQFKEIMAGDELLVERKNKDPYKIRPRTKHLFAANTLPSAEDEDPAFFRRIILVTFPNTIPEGERNPYLEDELKEELPGILNYALTGLNRLLERGAFFAPDTDGPEVTRQKWDSFGKSIKRFKTRCLEKRVDGKVAKSDVYDAYTQFCAVEGLPAESKSKVTRELKKDKDIGDGARVGSGNRRAYTGIELLEQRIPASPDRDDQLGLDV